MKFKKSISFALTLCMVLSLFATFVIPVAAAELPEGATGLDIYGYTHTHKNYVMYVDADMTLGELTAKYYGSSKDLNYFKVIVVNEDYTVAATYLDIDRNTNPASVKTDIAVTKGQVVLALSANEANVGRFEVAETVEVGDIVTLYNVDLAAENNTELTDAGFTVKAAPVTSKVVTDWNPVSYKESVGGATGAFIYDDADIYANCGNYWWIHAAFAPSATVEGGYEVVVANIVADIIIRLAPDVGEFLGENGVFIVSGIIEERANEVIEALTAAGYVIVDESYENGWYCGCVRRA